MAADSYIDNQSGGGGKSSKYVNEGITHSFLKYLGGNSLNQM